MSIKAIVFDFDGTLILSNELKYNAYFKLFPDEVNFRLIIKSVLEKHFEKSRYFIIRKILEELNYNSNIEKRINELAEKYNEIVVSEIINCKERENATEVLKKLKRNYKLYISSITPEEVLINIIKLKKWDIFFHGIFGYPKKKEETIREIIIKEEINNDELVFIGDGKNDEIAAKKANVNFINIDNIKMSELLDLEKIDVFK